MAFWEERLRPAFGFRAVGFCAVDAGGFGFGHLLTSVNQGSGEIAGLSSAADAKASCQGRYAKAMKVIVQLEGY